MKQGIFATAWNKLIDQLIAWRLLGITELLSGGWVHPWTVTPSWNGTQWVVKIQPGFIAGKVATVSMPFSAAPVATQSRLSASAVSASSSVDALLTERPSYPLNSFRNIGADAEPASAVDDSTGLLQFTAEAVPPFFAAMGVGAAPTFKDTGDDSITTVVSGLLGSNANTRLLRACDLAVYLDIPATATQWTTGSGIDGTFAQFSLTVQQPVSAKPRPYIQQSQKFSPPQVLDQSALLQGSVANPTQASWLLATVYLVSPPGAPLNSATDGSWSPYVAHALFWNRNFALNQPTGNLVTQNLTLSTGLAGGVGDATNNAILAEQNDDSGAAAQFLNNNLIQSAAWTV